MSARTVRRDQIEPPHRMATLPRADEHRRSLLEALLHDAPQPAAALEDAA